MLVFPLLQQEAPDLLPDGRTRPAVKIPTLEAPEGGEWGIHLDGFLDEGVWAQAVVIDGFEEVEPYEGRSADPKTEILMWRTGTHLYIGVNFHEPDPSAMVLQNQHRDAFLNDDDRLQFVVDTFGQSPTAYFFQLSAAGSRGDALLGDNGTRFNKQWDTYWEARARVQEDRWTAEIVIPFRSLASNESGVWRANFERYRGATRTRYRWTSARREYRYFNLVNGGTLTGMDDVEQGLGVTATPYFKVKRFDEHSGSRDWQTGFGGEVNWWITPQLKMSLTANTDFAETEVDDRRINLSQYSLFFPEKRDFFLEDANLFEFGLPRSNSLLPFYSRRIGLVGGEEVDVEAGARLSGRVGPWDLGLLAVRTGQENIDGEVVPEGEAFVMRPSYNFSNRVAVGGLLTYGNPATAESNLVTGLDTRFNDNLFGGEFDLSAFAVRSEDEADSAEGVAAGVRASLRTSNWQYSTQFFLAGDEFNPGLGFVQRPGQSNWSNSISFEPRPKDPSSSVRKYTFSLNPSGWFEGSWELMAHSIRLQFLGIEWHSGDKLELDVRYAGDRVTDDDFDPGGVFVGADFYDFVDYSIEFESSEARALALTVDVRSGQWYDGDRTRYDLGLNWRPSPTLSLDLEYEETAASLASGDFATRVVELGANLYASPALSWQNVIQVDNESDELGWQSRLRFIHRDGQELFLVANLGWIERYEDSIVPTERDMALKLVYSVRL
ncbi:MAG: carbohydrate binding family 9 domain-containing protein [Planctomycetes bacterium]|nr:carbohydrate binding family 9 domain-containing protein [Planctomycetota bacterium]